MASSHRALRLLGRSIPITSRLVACRSVATTSARANTTEPEKKPLQGTSTSQVRPDANTTSSSGKPSRPLPWKTSHISSPLHNPPSISADERPPYQYPTADPTPLPSASSSYDQTPAVASSSIRAALDAGPPTNEAIDWGTSYHGLSAEPFNERAQAILQAPIPMDDVEVKPDGIIYLPEIKYRRILNSAFGPGGWGLAPRGELHVGDKIVTREFALVVGGRFVAVARGECGYFGEENIPNAIEGCKSNALTRCCKDLGIASELWDPRFIRKYIKEFTRQVEVYYGFGVNAKKKTITIRKDDEVMSPYRLANPPKATTATSTTARMATSTTARAATTTAAASAARPAATTATKATTTAARTTAASAAKKA